MIIVIWNVFEILDFMTILMWNIFKGLSHSASDLDCTSAS